MAASHYKWNPSKEQIEAEIRRLGEIKLEAELRKTLQRQPSALRYLDRHRLLNPLALAVLVDQDISCEEWLRML